MTRVRVKADVRQVGLRSQQRGRSELSPQLREGLLLGTANSGLSRRRGSRLEKLLVPNLALEMARAIRNIVFSGGT